MIKNFGYLPVTFCISLLTISGSLADELCENPYRAICTSPGDELASYTRLKKSYEKRLLQIFSKKTNVTAPQNGEISEVYPAIVEKLGEEKADALYFQSVDGLENEIITKLKPSLSVRLDNYKKYLENALADYPQLQSTTRLTAVQPIPFRDTLKQKSMVALGCPNGFGPQAGLDPSDRSRLEICPGIFQLEDKTHSLDFVFLHELAHTMSGQDTLEITQPLANQAEQYLGATPGWLEETIADLFAAKALARLVAQFDTIESRRSYVIKSLKYFCRAEAALQDMGRTQKGTTSYDNFELRLKLILGENSLRKALSCGPGVLPESR